MMITMQGKYQTRDGRAVEILRTNVKNRHFPIVGIITERDGSETQDRWKAEGWYLTPIDGSLEDSDLIPVPTKHEGWCLVDTLAPTYPTRARAERAFDEGNYAVTPIGNPRYRIVFYTWED